jgi:hypothetical protein
VALGGADNIVASDLTLVECDRALIRAERLLGEPETDRRRASFQATSASWTISPLGPEIIARARKPFPAEPIRTLDALHLASALNIAESFDDLAVLSLDRRIRSSARALGLRSCPRPDHPSNLNPG